MAGLPLPIAANARGGRFVRLWNILAVARVPMQSTSELDKVGYTGLTDRVNGMRSAADERDDLRANAGKLRRSRLALELRLTSYPIKAFDLIGEDRARTAAG